MNILIPHTWLLEHLETDASPEEIQKLLSLSGPSVERIYDREGEAVYDIEVTTNRVDSMSVRGIAREAAVILSQAGYPSKLKPLAHPIEHISRITKKDSPLPLPEIHSDPDLCRRLSCVVLANVKRSATPAWMAKRLRQIDLQVHDATIDITNYITHELGHPCHAFDYDKVMTMGGKITVTEARAHTQFQTLDGEEFTTVGGEVVFTNGKGMIIDLPSIKGTKNTSIDDSTQHVLLLLESISAKKVRFASMTHAIRTTAAQLMEKNVDPSLIPDVLSLGVSLYEEICDATVKSVVFDDFPDKPLPKKISFSLHDVRRYLGIELTGTVIATILKNLGCIVRPKKGGLDVTPPSFRPDITMSADIVEEIARIYGYHNLPSTLMSGELPTNRPQESFSLEHECKILLSTLGAWELYTYSMIDTELATYERTYLPPTKGASHLELSNALLDTMTVLRRTLWASHLSVLANQHQVSGRCVYEMASVYIPGGSGELPSQEMHLTLTTFGNGNRIKGMLAALLSHIHCKAPAYRPLGETDIDITVEGIVIGKLLTVSYQGVLATVIDLRWHQLLAVRKAYPSYTPPSKFTPISEDLTFVIPAGNYAQNILDSIREIPQVTHAFVSSVYHQNVTFTLQYHDRTRQLDAQDAASIRSQIIHMVKKTFGATLVGTQ